MSISAAFKDALIKGLQDSIKEGHDYAKILSSGTASYAQLAAEDHPYAKRHGFPLRPVQIINMHRGAFFDAWVTTPVQDNGNAIEGTIENHALTDKGQDLSDFLTQPNGAPKSRMFQRPIDEEVEAKTATLTEQNINKQLEQFFNTTFIL